MNSYIVQFYSTTKELVEFAHSMRIQFNLTMVIVTRHLIDEIRNSVGTASLLLFDGDVKFGSSSISEFCSMNSNGIKLNVGTETDSLLAESSLTFYSKDDEVYKIAKKVASKLKKITKPGAVVVNPRSGAESVYKFLRYTVGAKASYDNGMIIRPTQGKHGENYAKLLD